MWPACADYSIVKWTLARDFGAAMVGAGLLLYLAALVPAFFRRTARYGSLGLLLATGLLAVGAATAATGYAEGAKSSPLSVTVDVADVISHASIAVVVAFTFGIPAALVFASRRKPKPDPSVDWFRPG